MHRATIQITNALKSPLEELKSSDVWDIWVTGTSVELRRKLMTTNGLHSTVLLQPSLPWEQAELPDFLLQVIGETIKCRNVRSVIVCYQPGDTTEPPLAERWSSNEEHLLQRIRARVERQRRAQARILAHLDQIRSDRNAGVIASPYVCLYGMFYIPESDAFLIYDQSLERFVPIAEAML